MVDLVKDELLGAARAALSDAAVETTLVTSLLSGQFNRLVIPSAPLRLINPFVVSMGVPAASGSAGNLKENFKQSGEPSRAR